jgi:hypothetical protein
MVISYALYYFRDYVKPFGGKAGLPSIAKDYEMDAAFARWPLAGPNPLMIQPCTQDILDTKVNMSALPETYKNRVNKALKVFLHSLRKYMYLYFQDNRLFVCDFSVLADLRSGCNDGKQKYCVGPLGLFEMPEDQTVREREWLQPLAVQTNRIEKDPTKPKPSIFTPDDKLNLDHGKGLIGI